MGNPEFTLIKPNPDGTIAVCFICVDSTQIPFALIILVLWEVEKRNSSSCPASQRWRSRSETCSFWAVTSLHYGFLFRALPPPSTYLHKSPLFICLSDPEIGRSGTAKCGATMAENGLMETIFNAISSSSDQILIVCCIHLCIVIITFYCLFLIFIPIIRILIHILIVLESGY